MSLLPEDPESTILKRLRRPKGDEPDSPDASPDQRSDNGTPGNDAGEITGYENTRYDKGERVGMRQPA
jgi:hypothetical protein